MGPVRRFARAAEFWVLLVLSVALFAAVIVSAGKAIF